jgi:Nuclease-related domain
MVSYPRRQRLRLLGRAGSRGALAAVALAAALLVAAANEPALAIMLAFLSAALGLASRHALRLAGRSRVGAKSEADVRRALEQLGREGWRVRHAVDWRGGGDLDHVVRAPSGIGFVVETKTLRFMRAHLSRTSDAARCLARGRRRYPRGVVPVLCLARARRVQRVDGEVLLVSLDRLVPSLRVAAGVSPPASQRSRADGGTESLEYGAAQAGELAPIVCSDVPVCCTPPSDSA